MAGEEAKYFERLDIAVLDIERIKSLIKNNIKNTINCWNNGKNIEKQTFHIIGPAGVGKTQSCKQLCDELTNELGINFGHIIIKSPVITRDDLLCPFPEVNNGATKFKMLYSDFIPYEKDSYGLFIIDEFGRGDHQLQQLCWQIMNEQKIHIYDFPKGWFIVCLDNPDDQEYSMDYLEDAAGLRRSLHIYSEVSVSAFLSYAVKAQFHPLVIEFINVHPDYLYDIESQKLGRVYANPASWERVSNILWGYSDSIPKHMNEIDYLCSGLLNNSITRMFIDFMINKDTEIRPKDILYKYVETEKKKILSLVEEANNTKIGKIMQSFMTFLATSKPEINEKEIENIKQFLLDLPTDIAATYFSIVKEIQKKDVEAFKYLTIIQTKLMKDRDYKEKFYDPLVNISHNATR